MPTLAWTLNRLRLMGPAEVCWRAGKAVQARLERHGRGLVLRPPAGAAPPQRRAWLDDDPGLDALPYYRAADRILAGRFDFFALRGLTLGFPPSWMRDPKTGTEAPLAFGKTLDYRDQSKVGDIKYLWELNRHAELVTLAQAYRLSGQLRYAQACRTLLESWWRECPYPLGPGWSSALENAVRLLQWAAAWDLLGAGQGPLFADAAGRAFQQRWLASIYQHCHFIASHRSRYSSANNHLLGEYAGLFAGATMWPCWPESRAWGALAKRGLEREALLQNGPDGVNREQAAWYHHEVADMMLLCLLLGRRHGIAFTKAFEQRLEAMLEFIAAIMDVSGNVPMTGDADDALLLRLSQEQDFHPYRSLLASGAALFGRADFKRKAVRFDDKSRWLTGAAGEAAFQRLSAPSEAEQPRRAFPAAGYYLLGTDFGTPSEIRIVADAGPLGYLSIAAHGHADALSFTLCAGGRELLIDPGTYAYHTQEKWRAWFRGTAAHNTVRIDGRDQSEPGGNFMWLSKAGAVCESWQSDPGQDCLVARHDGYLRQADPLLHRRKMLLRKREGELLVQDSFVCRRPHQAEFCWHFAETCEVSLQDDTVVAHSAHVRLEMRMPDCPGKPRLLVGSKQPPGGWVSRRLDQKEAAACVIWTQEVGSAMLYNTLIRVVFTG
jgi:hypothetical protein